MHWTRVQNTWVESYQLTGIDVWLVRLPGGEGWRLHGLGEELRATVSSKAEAEVKVREKLTSLWKVIG